MGGRERGLTRGLSSERKIFENLIFFLKQKTRNESTRSGTRWIFLNKQYWGVRDQGVRCVKAEYQGMGGW